MDRDARIIFSSTPRFAQVVAHKYAALSSSRVQEDLKENHGRTASRCLIQVIAEAMAVVELVYFQPRRDARQ
jgi:hypothetical protein